jgi:hypothetical protein
MTTQATDAGSSTPQPSENSGSQRATPQPPQGKPSELEQIDQESEQALLLEEAYQLGWHKVRNGCLVEPLKKLNAIIEQREEAAIQETLYEAYWAVDTVMMHREGHHDAQDAIDALRERLNKTKGANDG